jgi:Phosphoenolpyruvate hydrolase-like
MAKAGADILVAHMGLTTGGTIGAETVLTLETCAGRIDAIAEAALDVRSDIIVLCHGGPIAEPADAALVLSKTRHCHGFYGASSMERLPTEKAKMPNTVYISAVIWNYIFTYEIVEGTLPVRGYVAGVRLHRVPQGNRTFAEWRVRFRSSGSRTRHRIPSDYRNRRDQQTPSCSFKGGPPWRR